MVLGHRRHSGGSRSSIDDTREYSTEDETVVDAEQGNVLGHIISQLRPGADLSRVTLPTFILEPRSMLERITNFMAHPEIMLPMPEIDDPVKRFVSVVKFYLSGWHIKPPGVKKPLNPILGETFTCYWEYPDKTKGYYISEQTSHHPPKSSYFFMVPEHGIRIDGTLKPRSKFLGNSAASMMEGIAVMRFTNRNNERYFVTQPNMYARGILFGKMKYELGDHSFVRCPELGLHADLEFKTKGYFSGTYNAIGGFIRDTKTDQPLYELSGLWNGEMYIKDIKTHQKELLFNAKGAKPSPPLARPIEEQDERESQRLWAKVNEAIHNRDHVAATTEKSAIEDQQRLEASKRADDGLDWKPKLFRHVQGGPGGQDEGEEDLDWILNAKIDGKTSDEQIKQILRIAPILPGQALDRRFSIPSRQNTSSPSLSRQHTATQLNPHPEHPDAQQPSQAQQPPEAQQSQAQEPSQAQQPHGAGGELSHVALHEKLRNMDINHAQGFTQGLGQQAAVPAAVSHLKRPIVRQDSQTEEVDEFHDALD
ncbi:Oxysterol-binding protein [Microthyrium microscopicum]|uniref:Oxysterol-binding protein n=1 Tax=Microthyrium microscopicum TaxID=703497 RepID=A0A6A6UBE3_9PEZI|nr:Oxysterol-binding protein [Microthyrium microscopicum]